MLLEVKDLSDNFVLIDQLIGLFADAYLSSHPVRLHFVGNKDILTKDVIPHNLSTNDSSDNLSGVDSNSHV